MKKTPAIGVAYCGLFCFGCKRFIEGQCAGCKKEKASENCIIYQCAKSRGLNSCLECETFYKECDTWKKGITQILGENS